MKFKNLLSLGAMLSCGLVAQAQVPVFHESFEAAQTKQPTDVGYYEEINKEEGDQWSIVEGGLKANASISSIPQMCLIPINLGVAL